MYLKKSPIYLINFNCSKTKAILYNLMNCSELDFSGAEALILYELFMNNNTIERVQSLYGLENVNQIVESLVRLKIGKLFMKSIIAEPIKPISEMVLKIPKLRQFSVDRLAFEITGKCNLNCVFCTSDNIVYRSCGCKKWMCESKLEINDYYNIIDQAIKLNVKQLDLLGGEPLLEWDLTRKILEYSFRNNIRTRVFTNGSLLDRMKVSLLKKYNVQIILQILGFEKHYRDSGIDTEIYNTISNSVELLIDYKVSSTIYILTSSINEADIEQIKANYKSKGLICEEVYLYPSNRYFSPLYYKKMISPKIRELNINLFNYQIFQHVHCCLNSQIFISCNGSIYPCSMLREKTGDIFADELWELFHKGKLKKFWEIKKSDLDTCKECELNFKCFDCRALEYSKTKNLYGMHYCERVDQQISPPQDQV